MVKYYTLLKAEAIFKTFGCIPIVFYILSLHCILLGMDPSTYSTTRYVQMLTKRFGQLRF